MQACPKCKTRLSSSNDISLSIGTRLNMLSCPKCNYYGFPIEIRVADASKKKC